MGGSGKNYPLSIIIRAVDKATGPVNRINALIRRVTDPFQPVLNSVSSLGKAAGVDTLRQRFSAVTKEIGNVGDAAQTTFRRISFLAAFAGASVYLFKRQFIDTASLFENLKISLEGIYGSIPKAAGAMAFLKKITLDTPYELADLTKAFRTLLGFGVDPMNGTLQAIVDQVAKIGGSGDDLTGVAMQIGQAWSKGRLMAQDSNILVERGIPVWGLLSRAVERVNKGQKVSIGQLRKLSEDGKIGLGGIKLLLEQMGIESKGASGRMMRTFTGIISNLSDQWTFFKLRVMDSGPFQRIKDRLQSILDTVNVMAADGRLQQWADRIGVVLLNIFTWLETNGPSILQSIVSNMTTVGQKAQWIADLLGGWGNFISLGLAAYIAGPMVAAVIGLTSAIISLNVALLGTPAGWIIAVVAGLALGLTLLILKWDTLKASAIGFFRDITGRVKGFVDLMGGFKDGILGRGWDRFKTAAWSTDEDMRGRGTGAPTSPPANAQGQPAPASPFSFLSRPSAFRYQSDALTRFLSAANAAPQRSLSAGAAAPFARQPEAGQQGATARVEVDFKNTPPGTKVTPDRSSAVPLDLSVGFAFAGGF
jgi:tape measure domain-containing protein